LYPNALSLEASIEKLMPEPIKEAVLILLKHPLDSICDELRNSRGNVKTVVNVLGGIFAFLIFLLKISVYVNDSYYSRL
jgi:hypothetical protein